MAHPVFSSLIPVFLLIATGFLAARRGWMGAAGAKDLSTLVFMVLTPALLFRTMSTVHVERLDFRPVASYFIGAILVFGAMLLVRGFNRRGAVLALAATYSNLLMIGVPLVGLAYGNPALVTLFTLISVHALVLLTLATVVLEVAVLREEHASLGGGSRPMARTVALALRNGIVHPVPLPIIAGLLFAKTGIIMPAVVDRPLQLMATAFGPLALILVGVTLAGTKPGEQWRGALALSVVKNILLPALVAGISWYMGLRGLPLAVMVVAAAMPIGANVFFFSQRYKVAEELVTASVAVSTLLAVPTLMVIMWLLANPRFG